MAYFDDMTEQEIRQNKAIRGVHRPGPGERQPELAARAAGDERASRRQPHHRTGHLEAALLFGGRRLHRVHGQEGDGLQRIPPGRRHPAHEGGRRPRGRHEGRPRRRCLRANAGGRGSARRSTSSRRHQDGARRPARGHGQHLRRPLRVAQGGGLRDQQVGDRALCDPQHTGGAARRRDLAADASDRPGCRSPPRP